MNGDPPAIEAGGSWRYGKRGSLAVHVDGPRRGTFRDFEAGKSGGVLDLVLHLVEHVNDRAAAAAWLQAEGLAPHSPQTPRETPMTGRTERQYRRRTHYPARINFGITNELRTALEALADKADTCVAEVARDCIEAGIGERKYLGRQTVIRKKENRARLVLLTTTSAEFQSLRGQVLVGFALGGHGRHYSTRLSMIWKDASSSKIAVKPSQSSSSKSSSSANRNSSRPKFSTSSFVDRK